MNKKMIFAGAIVLATSLISAPFASAQLNNTVTSGSFKTALVSNPMKVHAAAAIGEPAPSWTLSDTVNKSHSLKDYAGKYVVLEWTNHQCPYVQKHYRTGNMQKLQKYATSHGMVWLSVISSAVGHEGYVTPEQGEQISKQSHSLATAKLLDPDGTVGHEYNAKTTPDIMIIDPKGVLVYSGGIDDKPTTDDADIKTAHNYVKAALEDIVHNKPIETSVSQPYGCGVKYGS